MTKSAAQLANAAIRNLGINPLSTETYSYVSQMVDPLFDELKGKNIADIASTSAIPERQFVYLSDLLAYKCMAEFADLVLTDGQLLAAKVPIAEKALKDMQRGKTAS